MKKQICCICLFFILIFCTSNLRAEIFSDGFDYPIFSHIDNDGTTENYYIALNFKNSHDYDACGMVCHPGEDWNSSKCASCDANDSVYAVSNGVIEYAEYASSGWGHLMMIRHDAPSGMQFILPDGGKTSTVWSVYGHMSSISNNPHANRQWKVGDEVYRGEQIGQIGDYLAGSGQAYHLHFEIRKEEISATAFPCGS